MTLKRGIIYALIVGLCAVFYVAARRQAKSVDAQIVAPILGPDDKAKIIFDPRTHTVTRVDDTGVHKTFLNPHGPVSIVEKKDGKTVLIQRTWGTELSPFAGGTFGSDFRFRVALGANLFYVQRWECGGGLLLNVGDIKDVRAFAHVGYNVYGNWIVSGAIDNQKTVHVLASLRF